MSLHFASTCLALLLERFIGYPKEIYRRIGHPVEWMGLIITELDNRLNVSSPPAVQNNLAAWHITPSLELRLRGVAALLLLLAAVGIPSTLLSQFFNQFSSGWIFTALIATTLLAQRSLREHVAEVMRNLDVSLSTARVAVARIVGRDTTELDESGISRAALESLAENTADGVIAPALWFAVLGLPGIAMYKAVNTADSMIGHKSERYLHFGWAAARFDDLVNLPASRLTGLLFAAAAAWNDKERGKSALRAMWRDAARHQSPNAGWPESALAGAIGVKLGGPRNYKDQSVALLRMGEGKENLNGDDISRGLKLFDRAMNIFIILIFACALVF